LNRARASPTILPVTTRARSGAPATAGARLADLALAPALAGARLVPEDASLDRPVSAIVLADADAPEEPGALVVCPGAPPDPLPAGCAGVVCRAAPAGDAGVPVLVLPPGAPWGAVLADLSAALSGATRHAGAAAARAALRGPLVEGAGFPGLAAAARDLLGAPVAILDDYLDLQGAAGLSEDQEEFLEAAVARARGHSPASVLGPFMEEQMPGLARALVAGPAGSAGVLVAWAGPDGSPGPESVLAELAEACALERAREEVRIETESRLRGDLIEELLAGEAVNRESLVRRARHLGADLSRGAVALIGTLQDPHTDGRLITDPRLLRRFMQQARAAMDLHWPRALVHGGEGRLLALLPPPVGTSEEAPREEIEAQAFTLGKRLLGATRETVPGLALTLALSRYTPEPERLGAALDESRLALAIGERLGRVGEVVTFEETGTYKLLFQIFADRPEELSSFYDQTIAPLVRYDEQYQTELVGTLSTYLGNDCNLAATASTLYTHRHTVRYRLDRIAELSGLDIAKTDDREKLSLGLKAMRLLGRRVASVVERPPRRGAGPR
jgi:sugar diacid utilization regulator